MKIRSISILIAVLVALFVPSISFGQLDQGQPDTAIILTNRPDVAGNDSIFIVEIWAWHDVVPIFPTVGFKWSSDKLILDSAKINPAYSAIFTNTFFYDGNIGNSNTNNRAMFSGLNFSNTGVSPTGSRYLVSTHYFHITPKWQASDEITVDTAAWDAGSEMLFLDPVSGDQWAPVYAYGSTPIRVLDPSDVGDGNGLPATYSLGQNYPNPFNPETAVNFSLEKAGEYTFTVYNVIGQVVDQVKGMGSVGHNEIHWNGSNQSSGVYFYRLESGNFAETKKMMLVK